MTIPAQTIGTLLGGRVTYAQPVDGYRTGIEPVLLAASVPARAGDRVIEAGTGAGAGLLTLAARVGGLSGIGLERDPEMAAFARDNLAANGQTTWSVLTEDVTVWQTDARYDHAMANPPWHDEAGTQSPDARRRLAKTAGSELLDRWAMALGNALVLRGTLTLILPAALLGRGLTAMARAKCAEISLYPLWPKIGSPARLVLLTGIREGHGPDRVCAGLTLHSADGHYTAEAEAVLRGGKELVVR